MPTLEDVRLISSCLEATSGRSERMLSQMASRPPGRLIDDVSGTMPPFERYIVLGPASADKVATEISERAGLPVMIVDANNLRKVDLVGISPGFAPDLRQACLEALESKRLRPPGAPPR